MICDPVSSDARLGSNDAEAAERGTARAAMVLFLIGASLLVGAGIVWGVLRARQVLLVRNPKCRIAKVEFQNKTTLLSRDDVLNELELSGKYLSKGVSLYDYDIGSRRRSFQEKHPEVISLSLKRLPPNGVAVSLEERLPMARIGRGDLVVDGSGVAFGIPTAREDLLESLPLLIDEATAGIRPGAHVGDRTMKALSILRVHRQQNPPLGFEIREIDMTSEVYLELCTENSVYIHIPMDILASEETMAKGLRCAANTLSTGKVPSGGEFTISIGADGRSPLAFLPKTGE